MSEIDTERMLDVLAAIEHSHRPGWTGPGHDQQDWARNAGCGTTLCHAGWATFLAGWEPVFRPIMVDNVVTTYSATSCRKGLQIREIDELAAELLDLSEDEAHQLFYNSTNEDMWTYCADLLDMDEAVLREKVADRDVEVPVLPLPARLTHF